MKEPLTKRMQTKSSGRKIAPTKQKPWGNFFMFAAIFVLILFIFENSFINPAVIITPFDFVSFIVVSSLSAAFVLAYAILANYALRFRAEIIALIVLGLVVLGNVIVISKLPFVLLETISLSNGETATIHVDITMMHRIRSLVLALNAALLAFVMLFIFPKQATSRGVMLIIAIVIIIIGYGLIGFSFISEFDTYINVFKNGIGNYVGVPNGPFVNRNLFASYLFISFLFCFYLWARLKKVRWLMILLSLPIAAVIYFTVSKTKIIMVTFVYLSLVVYWLAWLFRKHKVLFWILTPITVAAILSVPVFRVFPQLADNFYGQALRIVLPEQIFQTTSLISRTIIWKYGFGYLRHAQQLIFGRGFYISKMLLGHAMAFEPSVHFAYKWGNFHSGYLEVLSTGGLVLFIPYLAFIVYLFYVMIKIRKHNRAMAFYSFIAMVAFLIHSSVESVSLLLFNAEGIVHALPVVFPPLVYYHMLKRDGVIKSKWDKKHPGKSIFATDTESLI